MVRSTRAAKAASEALREDEVCVDDLFVVDTQGSTAGKGDGEKSGKKGAKTGKKSQKSRGKASEAAASHEAEWERILFGATRDIDEDSDTAAHAGAQARAHGSDDDRGGDVASDDEPAAAKGTGGKK